MKYRLKWVVAGAMLFGLSVSARAAEKKVLFLNSYHAAYPWSAGIIEGAKQVIGDKAEVKVHDMDTKRNGSEEFKKKAAEEAKKLIDEWKPDVVIAADDNACKYVIVPYFKDKDVPFVFCGVNWDASGYGFPAKNVTGMVEVALVPQLIEVMKKAADGDKVGFIGADTETNRKEVENIKKIFKIEMQEAYPKDMTEWKTEFVKIQDACDMVIVGAPSFAADGGQDELKKFMLENTKKVTGCIEEWVAPFAVIAYAKDSVEQGQWAATQALKIIEGTAPADIAIEKNKRAKIVVNAPLMKKIGKPLPVAILEQATIIKE